MGEVLRALREVFRNPALRRLQLAWFTTSVGLWGGSLALAVYAYDTGGPVAVGGMALLRTLPGAVAAPFLALEADRRPRRTILLLAGGAQAASTAAITAAVAMDPPLAVVYVLVALLATASPAYKPALMALLPCLARTPGELSAANVAASMVFNVGFVVGSLSAGVLLSVTALSTSFGVLAGALALALVPLLRIAADPAPDPEPNARPAHELTVLRLLHPGRVTAGITIGSVLLGGSVGALGLLPVVAVAALGLLGFGVGYTLVEARLQQRPSSSG